ncbi:hemerythrin domain-containing protein [Bdellovibrio sp. KM01]|uniref:hemerythrin domain-containing protein n=1 Tax=Bdellovibrio sp. KM01 TaxID=2748865 RepID=UPI0015EA6E56|nr:hemerythrin domain-containing protein [Bdellovibrio sp. KM01]QLY24854.1 hemerythrin domain-containing protein [Bdellovibrio sp. KM01]
MVTHKTNPSHPEDIVQLIKKDHKPLKVLLGILKNENVAITEKRAAFTEFAPLLEAHAKPEEDTWYTSLKREHPMEVQGMEGDLEHRLSDQICKDMKKTVDDKSFMAKAKVLAELVEHHIKEEEMEMLPEYEKYATLDERIELGHRYLELQQEIENRQYKESHKFPSSVLDNIQGKVGVPILLYILGVPGFVVILLWFFFFRGE